VFFAKLFAVCFVFRVFALDISRRERKGENTQRLHRLKEQNGINLPKMFYFWRSSKGEP